MSDPTSPKDQISLTIEEHSIGSIFPPGSKIEGKMHLPQGVIIGGDFVGEIFCARGSVIIQKGARFAGRIEADRIYIEGDIVSSREGRTSTLVGRQLVAAGSTARVHADLYSSAFAIHKAKLWGQTLPLEDWRSLERDQGMIGPALAHRAPTPQPVSSPKLAATGTAAN